MHLQSAHELLYHSTLGSRVIQEKEDANGWYEDLFFFCIILGTRVEGYKRRDHLSTSVHLSRLNYFADM